MHNHTNINDNANNANNANVRALAVDKLKRAASLPRRRAPPPDAIHPTQPEISDSSSPTSPTFYEPVEDYEEPGNDDNPSTAPNARETGQQVQVRDGLSTLTFSILEHTPRKQQQHLSKEERALLTLSQLQHQLISKHGSSLLSRSNSATARVNAFNKLVNGGQLKQILNERPPSRLLRSNTVSGAVGGRGSRDDARQAARANMLKRLGSRRELKNDQPQPQPEKDVKRRSSLGDISKFDSILNTQPQILESNLLLVPPATRDRKHSLESTNSFGTPSSAENGDKFEYERMLNTSTRSLGISPTNTDIEPEEAESDDDNSVIYEEVEETNETNVNTSNDQETPSKATQRRRRQVHFTPSAYIDELRKTLGPDRLAQLLGPQFVNEFGMGDVSTTEKLKEEVDEEEVSEEEVDKEEILKSTNSIEAMQPTIDEDIPLTEQISTNSIYGGMRKTRESSCFKPQPQLHLAALSAENAGSQAMLTRSMTTLPKASLPHSDLSKHKKVKSQRSFGSFRILKSKPSIQSNKDFYDSDPKLSPFPALTFTDSDGKTNSLRNRSVSPASQKIPTVEEVPKKLERKTSKMGMKLKRLFSVRKTS